MFYSTGPWLVFTIFSNDRYLGYTAPSVLVVLVELMEFAALVSIGYWSC
jgi:hypothetical protein